jgi:hypothetical protein
MVMKLLIVSNTISLGKNIRHFKKQAVKGLPLDYSRNLARRPWIFPDMPVDEVLLQAMRLPKNQRKD